VCALPSGHVQDALNHLGCQADVLSLDPYTLEEVLDTIMAVGEKTGVPERAGELVTSLRSRLSRVASLVAGRPRPRVALVEWVDPPFAAGHWIPDLVTAAGGRVVAARPGARSEPVTWPEIAAAGPDLILVAPCGYHLAGAVEQAAVAAMEIPGVPVWAIDTDALVVRPGPRLVDGIEAIAAILHTDVVPTPPDGQIALVARGGRDLLSDHPAGEPEPVGVDDGAGEPEASLSASARAAVARWPGTGRPRSRPPAWVRGPA
jgi:iron complex transport system substrate-binding protein